MIHLFSLLALPLVLGTSCGYNSCPETKDSALNVHIIPHSHDDTGWLKTVDQYYLGSNRARFHGWEENQNAGVQYILDTVVQELAQDPSRRFIQVEVAFFWRWWKRQPENVKSLVNSLVLSGQLEFVGGGWCMNDEAAAHYVDIIHQMSLGLRFLNDTFGPCARPRTAWQIDPFGHSKEQANLFADFGFDGLFFGRLDYRDRSQRLLSQNAEMVWHTNSQSSKSLFTAILFNYYSPPPGFCWDILCNDEPIMDNPQLHGFNVHQRIEEFAQYAERQAMSYRTNNIAITAGMDFHYQAAHSWFTNLDKLIKHTNRLKPELNLVYSTPSCYLKALHQANGSWPVKDDDFFPYASDPHAYWTGYYSSRPTSKRMIRETGSWLSAAKQMVSTQLDTQRALKSLQGLARSVAVTQHHDAITGTEKQYVAEDYHQMLSDGLTNFVEAQGIGQYCPLLNISSCNATEGLNGPLDVLIYNPSPRSRSVIVRLPVVHQGPYEAFQGQRNHSYVVQIVEVPSSVLEMPGRHSLAKFEAVVHITDIPPLSFEVVHFQLSNKSTAGSGQQVMDDLVDRFDKAKGGLLLLEKSGNDMVHLDTQSGIIYKITKASGRTFPIHHDFAFYIGHPGNNSEFENRASGAYIFRPLGNKPKLLGNPIRTKLFQGKLFHEVHNTFKHQVSQVVRVPRYEGALYDLEVEWMVGPIDISDGLGKEFIHRIDLEEADGKGVFFTDSNGRQFMKRLKDHRETYPIPDAMFEEPVSSNYYPVTMGIFIKNSDGSRLTVLTDRSQGGSCINNSTIELMVHRRLLDDDAFGVNEALNETAFGHGLVARGKHYILVDEDEQSANFRMRLLANEIHQDVVVTFPDNGTEGLVKSSVKRKQSLPDNVNLLSLEPLSSQNNDLQRYLIRLEHLFDHNEHPLLSQPVKVCLHSLILDTAQLPGHLAQIRETTLGGNQWLEDSASFHWIEESNEVPTFEATKHHFPTSADNANDDDLAQVILQPLQIRTFVVEMT